LSIKTRNIIQKRPDPVWFPRLSPVNQCANERGGDDVLSAGGFHWDVISLVAWFPPGQPSTNEWTSLKLIQLLHVFRRSCLDLRNHRFHGEARTLLHRRIVDGRNGQFLDRILNLNKPPELVIVPLQVTI
jgi:hypothetical protein